MAQHNGPPLDGPAQSSRLSPSRTHANSHSQPIPLPGSTTTMQQPYLPRQATGTEPALRRADQVAQRRQGAISQVATKPDSDPLEYARRRDALPGILRQPPRPDRNLALDPLDYSRVRVPEANRVMRSVSVNQDQDLASPPRSARQIREDQNLRTQRNTQLNQQRLSPSEYLARESSPELERRQCPNGRAATSRTAPMHNTLNDLALPTKQRDFVYEATGIRTQDRPARQPREQKEPREQRQPRKALEPREPGEPRNTGHTTFRSESRQIDNQSESRRSSHPHLLALYH